MERKWLSIEVTFYTWVPGGIVKTQIVIPHKPLPEDQDLVGFGWGLIIFMANRFSDVIDANNLRTILWEPLV